MIVEEFASLPPSLLVEGVVFSLQLLGPEEGEDKTLCLAYGIDHVRSDSRHIQLYDLTNGWYNPFSNGEFCLYLWFQDGIETDQDLLDAIRLCKIFLRTHSLVSET